MAEQLYTIRFPTKTVVFENAADIPRYEEDRSREIRFIQRMIEENRDQGEYADSEYQYVQPPQPDFKTMVQELTWLDQRDTVPVPPTRLPRFEPLIFPHDSPSPASIYDPYRMPIMHMYPPPVPLHTPPPHLAEYFQLRARLAENRNKYMQLLSATEFFCAGEWTSEDMDSIYDGVYQANTDSPQALAAANFAISSLASEKRSSKQLNLKRLIRANVQFLGRYGSINWLTLQASNHKFYEAVVVVSSNESERVLKYIRPAKYFPEIPAHLRHLLGPNY